MHPKAFEEYERLKRINPGAEALRELASPHHFFAGLSVCSVAKEMSLLCQAAARSTSDLVIPFDARLPSDRMVLVCEDGEHSIVFFLNREATDPDIVIVHQIGQSDLLTLGGYYPGTGTIRLSKMVRQIGAEFDALKTVWRMSFIMSLINTPRLVVGEKRQAPRQQRRRMERTIGQPALGFTEVRWTIAKATKASGGEGKSGRGLPLHWNRAHWRVAKEGDPKAEWREAGPHGSGWYTWVTDYWAGHPDFGLKLQLHVPQIEGEARSRPGALAPSKSLSGERLAVMNEVKRNALIASGYATV